MLDTDSHTCYRHSHCHVHYHAILVNPLCSTHTHHIVYQHSHCQPHCHTTLFTTITIDTHFAMHLSNSDYAPTVPSHRLLTFPLSCTLSCNSWLSYAHRWYKSLLLDIHVVIHIVMRLMSPKWHEIGDSDIYSTVLPKTIYRHPHCHAHCHALGDPDLFATATWLYYRNTLRHAHCPTVEIPFCPTRTHTFACQHCHYHARYHTVKASLMLDPSPWNRCCHLLGHAKCRAFNTSVRLDADPWPYFLDTHVVIHIVMRLEN
jgi:hypothetical protein